MYFGMCPYNRRFDKSTSTYHKRTEMQINGFVNKSFPDVHEKSHVYVSVDDAIVSDNDNHPNNIGVVSAGLNKVPVGDFYNDLTDKSEWPVMGHLMPAKKVEWFILRSAWQAIKWEQTHKWSTNPVFLTLFTHILPGFTFIDATDFGQVKNQYKAMVIPFSQIPTDWRQKSNEVYNQIADYVGYPRLGVDEWESSGNNKLTLNALVERNKKEGDPDGFESEQDFRIDNAMKVGHGMYSGVFTDIFSSLAILGMRDNQITQQEFKIGRPPEFTKYKDIVRKRRTHDVKGGHACIITDYEMDDIMGIKVLANYCRTLDIYLVRDPRDTANSLVNAVKEFLLVSKPSNVTIMDETIHHHVNIDVVIDFYSNDKYFTGTHEKRLAVSNAARSIIK